MEGRYTLPSRAPTQALSFFPPCLRAYIQYLFLSSHSLTPCLPVYLFLFSLPTSCLPASFSRRHSLLACVVFFLFSLPHPLLACVPLSPSSSSPLLHSLIVSTSPFPLPTSTHVCLLVWLSRCRPMHHLLPTCPPVNQPISFISKPPTLLPACQTITSYFQVANNISIRPRTS